jgi:Family of unknown function (DUF6152)
MNRLAGTLLAGAASAAASCAATAHHSIGMFDNDHPIELVGTVQDYRFSNPHAFILLEVRGADGRPVVWRLEGSSANSLSWDGWSNQTLRPGDDLRLIVEPLRSGAPGGAWNAKKARFRDGRPIVAAP